MPRAALKQLLQRNDVVVANARLGVNPGTAALAWRVSYTADSRRSCCSVQIFSLVPISGSEQMQQQDRR